MCINNFKKNLKTQEHNNKAVLYGFRIPMEAYFGVLPSTFGLTDLL